MNKMTFENDIKQWLLNGAVISFMPGRLLVGWGRRDVMIKHADQNISFYFPDFFLKHPQPWFQYEYTKEIPVDDLLQLLSREVQDYCSVAYTWTNNYKSLFYRTFDELKQQMAAHELDKAVPFVFESTQGAMSTYQLKQSLYSLLKYIREYPVYIYGFWNQSEGMLGLTPEILFRYNGDNQLQTMACAGTCRHGDNIDNFLSDTKQASEHQCVIQGINETLASFGKVHIGTRQLLSLPNLNHLVTPISVNLYDQPVFDKIVKALHPTPALGAFPRIPGMQWLKSYQRYIQRERFGAPAGFLTHEGSAACYVAIRNVQWNQARMYIGAGCGIVPASQCESEWAEINLKLKATKDMLGLL
jgi:menaquinone-specific isochorismate synthase